MVTRMNSGFFQGWPGAETADESNFGEASSWHPTHQIIKTDLEFQIHLNVIKDENDLEPVIDEPHFDIKWVSRSTMASACWSFEIHDHLGEWI